MRKDKQEYICCAAVWYKEIPLVKKFDANVNPINVDRGLVFCGHRHPHCIYTKCSITGLRDAESGENEQGFLTSKNRFVDREEGMKIAVAANQVSEDISHRQLFSEDLY